MFVEHRVLEGLDLSDDLYSHFKKFRNMTKAAEKHASEICNYNSAEIVDDKSISFARYRPAMPEILK